MQETVFSNARLVLEHDVLQGQLRVQGGQICEIAESRGPLHGSIDLAGDYLLPGLVEVHTDNLERHLMPRPQVHFPMPCALQAHDAEIACAGITTVLDAIGVGDPYGDGFRAQDQKELLTVLDSMANAGALRAEHLIHVRCELPASNAQALFQPFAQNPRLRLISLMDHTPGQRQWTDPEHARTYYTGKKGWSHARFDEELRLAPQRQAEHVVPNRAWFAEFARAHQIALASHDDTTVAHVEQAKALGARMSEFPTTLAAAQHAHALGLATVAGAPNIVRGGSHSGNVAAVSLARAGVLDALSSDYVPTSLLHAAWRLQREAVMTLPQAVALISRRPALACALPDRGALAPGLRADLVQVRELNGLPVVMAVFRQGFRVA